MAKRETVFENLIGRAQDHISEMNGVCERLEGLARRLGVGGLPVPAAPEPIRTGAMPRGADLVSDKDGEVGQIRRCQGDLDLRLERLRGVTSELEAL